MMIENRGSVPIEREVFGDSSAQTIADIYRQQIETTSNGPQTEGVDEGTVAKLLDTDTVRGRVIIVQDVGVPIIFRAIDVDVMRGSYLANRYGQDATERSLYYSPSFELGQSQRDQVAQSLRAQIDSQPTPLLYEEEQGITWKTDILHDILQRAGVTYQCDVLIDPKNNSEASIIHYDGLAVPNEVADTNPTTLRDLFEKYYNTDVNAVRDGVTFLDNARFAEDTDMQDYIWELCNTQFEKVVENLPVRQSPTKEELIEILSHPSSSTIMYLEAGKPITLSTFTHSVEACSWLRQRYFAKYADEWLGYYAFLVTDSNRQGEHKSHELLNVIFDLIDKAKTPMRVVFECTNISADYIPYGIVQPLVNGSGKITIQLREVARYITKSVLLNP